MTHNNSQYQANCRCNHEFEADLVPVPPWKEKEWTDNNPVGSLLNTLSERISD